MNQWLAFFLLRPWWWSSWTNGRPFIPAFHEQKAVTTSYTGRAWTQVEDIWFLAANASDWSSTQWRLLSAGTCRKEKRIDLASLRPTLRISQSIRITGLSYPYPQILSPTIELWPEDRKDRVDLYRKRKTTHLVVSYPTGSSRACMAPALVSRSGQQLGIYTWTCNCNLTHELARKIPVTFDLKSLHCQKILPAAYPKYAAPL